MTDIDSDSRMNILFVHENAGISGGAETNIHITAEELKACGHRLGLLFSSPTRGMLWQTVFPSAWCWDPAGTSNSKVQTPAAGAAGRSGAPRAKLQKPSSERTSQFAVREVLAEFKPDIVYLHKIRNLDLFEALLRTGVPVVRMVHDHEMYCLRQYKYNPVTRAICTRSASGFCVFPCLAPLARNRTGRFPIKWASYGERQREMRLSRQCDRLIVYSEYSKAELVGNGFDRDKIHLHVPIRCWGDKGPVSSFSDRNLILFAGQIIRGKGLDVLLKALTKLRTPFECLILGDGNHRRYCEALSKRLGLQNRVRFAGYVPHDQMREFYLEASVFAMPSVWPEPFGMAGPEAMRYGIPVVTFDSGGIREWLQDGENGFLAPWMDEDAFAAKVQLLLTDKALARRLGRNGLAHVNSVYDSRLQAGRLEHLFRELSNEGRYKTKQRSSPTAGKPAAAQSFKLSEKQPAMTGAAV